MNDIETHSIFQGLWGNRLPAEARHVVIGHGYGSGKNWRFFNGERVQDYVNKTIPKGEKAWAVVCETGNSRSINDLEGKWVESEGR